MMLVHNLRNDIADLLDVWVEPWADLYVVPRGSKIGFTFDVPDDAKALESEIAGDRMTFWFSGPDAPKVTIDGVEAEPQDQYEWRSFKDPGRYPGP